MILSILIIYYTKSKTFWNSQYCVMVSTKNNVYFYVENVINSITKMMWLDHILKCLMMAVRKCFTKYLGNCKKIKAFKCLKKVSEHKKC